MSVTLRRYKRGGLEVDIRVTLPDGSEHRQRRKCPLSSKSAAQRWGEDRERRWYQELTQPKSVEPNHKEVPTLKEFWPRFMEGYAKANRQKPSGIAGKETIGRRHLGPMWGHRALDRLSTEDVQRFKATLTKKSPKTVNNILTVLNVLLKKAVEWGVLSQMPCAIRLLPVPKSSAGFLDFEQYERLVAATAGNATANLVVLLGGEAGLRCGEMMALRWQDVDFAKRQLCVERSDWKGHVSTPKGGRLRYVPLTERLTRALQQHRHLRGGRVLCQT